MCGLVTNKKYVIACRVAAQLKTNILLIFCLSQLRYLQTLNSISAEHNSTIIFPVPIDILSNFMGTGQSEFQMFQQLQPTTQPSNQVMKQEYC